MLLDTSINLEKKSIGLPGSHITISGLLLCGFPCILSVFPYISDVCLKLQHLSHVLPHTLFILGQVPVFSCDPRHGNHELQVGLAHLPTKTNDGGVVDSCNYNPSMRMSHTKYLLIIPIAEVIIS